MPKSYSELTETYLRSSGLSMIRHANYLGLDTITITTPSAFKKLQTAFRDAVAVSTARRASTATSSGRPAVHFLSRTDPSPDSMVIHSRTGGRS
jgi:hypothetical protein